MTVQLRRLELKDLPGVMALAGSAPEAPHWGEAVWRGVLAKAETIALGVFAADALAGLAVATVTLETVELEAIAVDAAFRRRGLGAALLEQILMEAGAWGATRVELEVRASNAAAIALYRQAGLVDEGVRRGYYRDPHEDALLMGCALTNRPD